ncbi:MAG: hypothetical protein IT458_02420 [Planctomycetes bacterium]|nr:hypothetical protein [Planctomycetota bacterium]
MTQEPKDKPAARIYCRRVQRDLPVQEHGACPYCFGARQQIRTGEHGEFCDYHPDKDPVNFGFPPDSSRNLSG